MKQFSKDLGRVTIVPKGKWSREQEYEKLTLVYNACDNFSYISKIDVPSGVDIENREYWQPMNATGYADNNFINLTAENENGIITAYETLEEAVATILPINRKAGATLSFYNLNSDRLDRQAEFELWQFNSTDLANWENKDYWNNIYYNWNVFAGWYVGADALKNHVKIPNVGQYAYVGTNLNDALLYQCRTNGIWTNANIKVRNYISVVVSGNITIGENGNWFSDGEDTGIPATPAVDEQLDNIIIQLQQHATEIDKLQKQDVDLKSNIDSNFETINKKVDNIKTTTYNKIDAADANLQNQITGNDNDIATLNTKHESLSKTVQGIAATGGASTATNVTYNNDSSGLNAENAQDAIDELENKKFDKASIVQESGEAEDKVISQKVVTSKLIDLNEKYTKVNDELTSVQNILDYIGLQTFMPKLSTEDSTLTHSYISEKGVIIGINNAFLRNTNAIKCNIGEIIFVKAKADKNMAVVAKVNQENYTSVEKVCVAGDGRENNIYFYKIEEDGFYAASGYSSNGLEIIIASLSVKSVLKINFDGIYNLIENITVSLKDVYDENGNTAKEILDAIGIYPKTIDYTIDNDGLEYGYINKNGNITAVGNQAFLRTKQPLKCNKGDVIIANVTAGQVFSVISKVNESFDTVLKVCVIGEDDNEAKEYLYFVEEDGFYAVSAYRKSFNSIHVLQCFKNGYASDLEKYLSDKINNIPLPNSADFSISDWQTINYYCFLFHSPVFCGDSTYEGHIVSDKNENNYSATVIEYSMPSCIKRILPGWNVKNVSKSAITIKNWMNTYFHDADFENHDIAFLGFGWNEPDPTTTIEEDVNQYEDRNQYADTIFGNYCKLIENIKDANPKIYIVLTIPQGLYRQHQIRIDAIKTIANKYNIPVIDMNVTDNMEIPVSTRDGIHNTPLGYLKTAQFIIASFARICKERIIEIHNTIYNNNVQV